MSKKEYDGLRYPSIDDLLKVVDSKYKLAYVSAKRAKIIDAEEYTSSEDPLCVKPVGEALEELLEGKLSCSFKDPEEK